LLIKVIISYAISNFILVKPFITFSIIQNNNNNIGGGVCGYRHDARQAQACATGVGCDGGTDVADVAGLMLCFIIGFILQFKKNPPQITRGWGARRPTLVFFYLKTAE
jgi:hypothetical protein